MGKLIGFIIFTLLDIPAVIFRGYVLTYLWLWFAVPIGAPAISIPIALGLSLTANTIMANIARRDDPKDASFTEIGVARLMQSVLITLMAWGLGAIIVSFV